MSKLQVLKSASWQSLVGEYSLSFYVKTLADDAVEIKVIVCKSSSELSLQEQHISHSPAALKPQLMRTEATSSKTF